MFIPIINHQKIKYDVLINLLSNILLDVKEVNCFISLDVITKQFYGRSPDEVAESLNHASENALSAEIINYIAHYRHFFWSRYGIPSNYFVYYSFDMADYPCSLNEFYKEPYYEKRRGLTKVQEYKIINEKIEYNMNLIKIISEYLPNIYFINTYSLEPAVLPQLIINKNKPKKEIHNLILTNEVNEYQLVNNPYTTVIHVNGDHSKIITKSNIMNTLIKSSTNHAFRKDVINNLSYNFYLPTLAFCGYKKYNIPKCKGVNGVVTFLKKLLKLYHNNQVSDIKYTTLDSIALFYLPVEDNTKQANINYNILNLKHQTNLITKKQLLELNKQINNKSDNMSLMEINNEYYKDNPLMLIELMEGEE